jgi:hypothetical protein
MEDYEQSAHFFYLNANYAASERVNLFGTLSLTMSTAELDQVIMPDVSGEVSTILPHQDFTFDEIHTYSDLDYTILSFSAGFEFKVAPGVSFTADGEYSDLTDDQPYVFGDESGSLFMIRSGLRFDL